MSDKNPRVQLIQTHALLLLVAFGIWWLVNQGVRDESVLEDAASVRVELALEDADGQWVIKAIPSGIYNLKVAGPRDEINRFSETIGQEGSPALFRSVIDENMLAAATPSEDGFARDITIQLADFERIQPRDISREITVAFEQPEREVTVRLERVTNRRVVVRLGEVKERANYTAKLEFDALYTYRAAYSSFNDIEKDKDGNCILTLPTIDLSDIGDPEIDRTIRVPVELPEGVRMFREGADGNKELNAVDVRIAFTAKEDYGNFNERMVVGLNFPAWMMTKNAKVSGYRENLNVVFKYAKDSAEFLKSEHVRVALDLSGLREAELKPTREGTKMKATIPLVYYSVVLEHAARVRVILPENRSLGRYFEHRDLVIEWDAEGE